MPRPRILSRYVAREVLQYTALGLATLTLLFLGEKLLRFAGELFTGGFSPGEVGVLLRGAAIAVLVYSAPAAFLFGVLLASGRLAADLEITAMRSCGLGLRALLVPVAVLGLLLSGALAYLSLEVQHRTNRAMHDVARAVAARGGQVAPGRFTRFGDGVLYVERQLPDAGLAGILIADRSRPERPLLIFAERGRLLWEKNRDRPHFRLLDGEIHVERAGRGDPAYERISFALFDYSFPFDVASATGDGPIRPSEMSMAELRAVLARAGAGDRLDGLRERNPYRYRWEIHRRFALPAAPVVFALLGVPLGLRRVHGARSRGVLLCALLGLAYYVVLAFGQTLALASVVPAAVAVWAPNAVFALVAVVTIHRARVPADPRVIGSGAS
jgi:lipopolysaccharide export system permease protein